MVEVVAGPELRTWDITTDTGNFYANGVLVHNCDEIDEMDQGILDAALGQPMTQSNYLGDMVPTQTVLSSTHQYPDKTMSTMLARARERGWPVHEWCYKESSNLIDGWLTPEGIERARDVVSALMWSTEYDLQEPSFGGRAIDTDAVNRCFDPKLGEYPGTINKTVQTPRIDGRHYITGVDWAKTKDQTIICTFDMTELPWLCVAWTKVSRLPWPMLVAKAVEQWRAYGGILVHDNTGVGAAANDLLRDQVTTSEFNRVKAFTMTGGRARDAFYTEYVSAIEHDEIRYPRIDYAYKEHLYVTPEALFTGKEHAPDTVVAGALAWTGRHRTAKLLTVMGGTRQSSPWSV